MSKNVNQVYMANPASSMVGTDLMYLGRSPYGITDDFAILWSDMQSSITAIGTIATGVWNGTVIGTTYGGTGVSNPTAHGILIGEGASPITPIVLSSGQILIGSTGIDPVAAAMNSGTGVLVANGAGSITVGLAPIATLNLLSNITGGSTAPIPNTLTATIDAAIGSTQGNILYRNATVWTVLAPGTSGNFLQTQGAAANPIWAAQAAPTSAALTKTDDTNVTLTLGGSPTTALLAATSITAGWTGQLGLTRGGTAASLTASNGGIVYSTASAMAILSGTATAGQMLQSGASTTPAWTTSTYPATNAVNTLLYASSANVMAALPTVNSAGLLTSSGGVPGWVAYTGSGAPVLGTSPLITTPNIVGTATNDNAAAGSVGELLSVSVLATSAVSLTSNTAVNIATLSLTAGDWDVEGNFYDFFSVGSSQGYGWVSLTSATLPDSSLYSGISIPGALIGTALNNVIACRVPFLRVSIGSTTTVYLSTFATFASGTATGCGNIYARRRR